MSDGFCLVLDVWDPRRGGLEAYASDLCRALRDAGKTVRVLAGEARAGVPDGCETIETGSRGVAFYRDVDDLAERDDLGSMLAFRHPGRSAHVFLPLGGLLVSSLAARRAAEPWWVRGPRALARALSAKTRAFLARERAFFGGERTVLASSALVRDEIRARFPEFRGRVEVTGLPIDETRFRPPEEGERASLRRELFGVDGDAPCILWIGNDPVRKGLNAARTVLRRLRLRKLDARLVLAGRLPRGVARGAGVQVLGHVEDTAPLYRAADVLLAPSLEDNLSFSVLEALASGLPVVTTRRNGAASYLTEPAIGRVVDGLRDVHALDGATLALLARGMLDESARAARRAAVAGCFREAHFAAVLALLE